MFSSVYSISYIPVHVSLQGSRSDQENLLLASTTLYVGNMSFYTTGNSCTAVEPNKVTQCVCMYKITVSLA